MSHHEYQVGRELERRDIPFYALIMAAMRKADRKNLYRLMGAYPEVWDELERRYNAPGGWLPEDGER
jgi:hypothetical protein